MGNSLACFSKKNQATKIRKKFNKNNIPSTRRSSSNIRRIPPPPCISRSTSRKSDRIIYRSSSRIIDHDIDHDYIREQARVAAALLLQHHHQNGTFSQFERSVSLRDPLNCSSRKQKRYNNNNIMPRSSSSRRARSQSDSLPHHLELLRQVSYYLRKSLFS